MKEYMKRIIAIVLAFVLAVSGLYLTAPEVKEVQAASESAQSNVVNENMLSIKMQASEPDENGRVNLRIVSSVDSLDYKNAGFEVWYGKAAENPTQENMTTKFTTGTAHERIRAGVEYNYSPKVIDPSSEWFVTGIIKNIHSSNLGKDFYIRAFCTTFDGEVVYGVGRYFNVNDASSKSVINIPIAMREAPVTDGNGQLTATVKVGTQSTTATLENYLDGYAQLNVSVTDKTALKSATKISIGGVSTIYRNLESSYNGTADTSWYDVYAAENPNETEFVIATDADLYGFAALSANNDFAGKTVYQVEDIVANKGTAKETGWDKGTDGTEYPWTSIGTANKAFAGNFDGQGHTISGLNKTENSSAHVGLFGKTTTSSTIKNISVKNSYFEYAGSAGEYFVGGVVGEGAGTIDTVYSNAVITHKKYGAGGIVGCTKTTLNIVNSQFDGSMSLTAGQNARICSGGIVGYANTANANVKISHCLNNGTIINTSQGLEIGGFVGSIQSATVRISDSLNTGAVTGNGYTNQVTAIVGRVRDSGKLYIDKTYASYESLTEIGKFNATHISGNQHLYQNNGGTIEYLGSTAMLSLNGASGFADMKGENAYKNTLLQFGTYWTAVEGKAPVLTSFVTDEQVVDIAGIDRTAGSSTMWYTGATGTEEDPYVLEDAADLYGFANLVNEGKDFDGKRIVMANDITVNASDRETWTSGVLNAWTPAGSYNSRPFQGHFDGQGYTISGLYQMKTSGNSGQLGLFGYTKGNCVIENLKLKNSQFTYTGTEDGGRMGSFVAWADAGVYRNLYSDAHLTNSKWVIGGILGLTNGDVTISNCWFDGSVKSTGSGHELKIGGILGWANTKTNIEHCLNSGSIHSDQSNNHPSMGGILGHASDNIDVEIKDCLNVGKITSNGAFDRVATLVGSSGGYPTGTTRLILHKTYATNESMGISTLLASNQYNNSLCQGAKKTVENVSRVAENTLYGVNGYKSTLLDFDDYWTAVDGGTPILTTFITDEKTVSVEGIDRPTGKSTVWAGRSGCGTESNPYILEDAADLAYFVDLMNQGSTPRYNGKYFALGDDIIWNASDRESWSTTAPLNSWAAMGNSNIKFAGHFDGRGYSISGLYQTAPKSGYFGLFGFTTTGCVIENLSITNSAFIGSTTGDSGRMGSFVAYAAGGTFRNLYSDATLTNSDLVAGGILGLTDGENTVSNCWFDGDVYSTSDGGNLRGAGIIGWVFNGPVTVEHCLNTGSIKSNASAGQGPQQGGLIGYIEKSTVEINDCLNTGLVSTAGATGQVSTLVGRNTTNATTTIKNTYATIESCGVDWLKTQPASYLYQADGNISTENLAMLTSEGTEGFLPINGSSGYLNTNLMFDDSETDAKFDSYWVAIEGEAPMLKTFATSNVMDLTTLKADTSWYTGDKSEYTIRTAEELYGVAKVADTTFEGITLKLGNDITCNRGEADKWSANIAPDYSWTPIANFSGHFNGKGHAIKGVYYKNITDKGGLFGVINAGSVIENFRLENSYFASTTGTGTVPDARRMGCLAGHAAGTYRNIYSDAILETNTLAVGGFIGVTIGTNTEITNCWFDGTIITKNAGSSSRTGGIVGWVWDPLTMTACLNTGTINAEKANANTSGHEIGGLIGRLDNANVAIDNCLNAGKLIQPTTAPTNVGALIGNLYAGRTATVTNTYAITEDNPSVLCNGAGTFNSAVQQTINKESLIGNLAQENTTLDFTNYWVTRQDSTPILQASFSWVWLSELEVPVDMIDYSKKIQAFDDTNGRMLSVFHKGDTVYYPENSIEAVISAIQMGADVVEVDLCITKDGKLVLMHDASDLSQTTDWDVKNGTNDLPTSKKVVEWTLAELRELRLKKGDTVTEYVIPTFEEVLKVANGRTKLVLDKEDMWGWNNDVYPLIKAEEAWDTCILPRNYSLSTKKDIVNQLKNDSGQSDLQVCAFVNFDGSASDDWNTMRDAGMIPIAYWTKECVTPEILDAATQLSTIKGNIRICGQNHASVSGSSETAERWNLLYENGVNMVLTDRGIDLQKYIAAKFYQ